jgi:hypothetical protein
VLLVHLIATRTNVAHHTFGIRSHLGRSPHTAGSRRLNSLELVVVLAENSLVTLSILVTVLRMVLNFGRRLRSCPRAPAVVHNTAFELLQINRIFSSLTSG